MSTTSRMFKGLVTLIEKMDPQDDASNADPQQAGDPSEGKGPSASQQPEPQTDAPADTQIIEISRPTDVAAGDEQEKSPTIFPIFSREVLATPRLTEEVLHRVVQLQSKMDSMQHMNDFLSAELQLAQKTVDEQRGVLARCLPAAPSEDYEGMAMIEDKLREPISRLERLALYHKETITSLEQSNEVLRKQLLDDEVAHDAEVARLREEIAKASFVAVEYNSLGKDLTRSREENSRLVARLAKLMEAVKEKEALLLSASQQIEALMDHLKKRDADLEALQQGGTGLQEVRQSRFFQPILQNQNRLGQVASRFVTAIDLLSLRAGRFLRTTPAVRVAAVLYIVLLHFYVLFFRHRQETSAAPMAAR